MNKKLFLTILLICVCGISFAQQKINEKYSYKDFMNKSFKGLSPSEFNDSIVIGSNFYQEAEFESGDIEKDIFPDGLKNVTFEKCNLDNVRILDKCENCKFVNNSMRVIKVQNDLEDWVLNKQDGKYIAVEPVSKSRFIEVGVSIDPKSIPAEKQTISITEKVYEENISISSK